MSGLYTPRSIITYTGLYIDVVHIKPEQVQPADIAIGLSRECRFGNHTKKYYSVADHSVWCMKKARELYPSDTVLHLKMLLHDAHEAYLGDMCTPLVDSIDALAPGFKDIIGMVKQRVQSAIDIRFGIRGTLDDERVKAIDKMALEYEWENKVEAWTGFPPVSMETSASIWLEYFKELVKVPVVIAV
jgi:5'-deoxynucleotidase YfbR-like HD superfamily hydrolase